MPYASNARDGSRVYFEDDDGDGPSVVLHGEWLTQSMPCDTLHFAPRAA
jgi:hypothetical protein